MNKKIISCSQLFCPGRVDFFCIIGAIIFSVLIFSQGLALDDNKDSKISLSSLNEALVIALKNNLNIQMQEKEVAASRANITVARAAFFPQLNANASYTHNEKVFLENIFSGYTNDNYLGFTLNQNIYSGGANYANFKQSLLQLKIQEETLRFRKLDLEFETKRLYYGLLLAYETERITEDLFFQAEQHYADVEHKFAQGTASRFDVLQSSVQVSKIMPELVRARNAVDVIKADLKKLLKIKMLDD
ncbi:MAG: TolC family protein, partial [Candidatus Omnitrophota bacterium]